MMQKYKIYNYENVLDSTQLSQIGSTHPFETPTNFHLTYKGLINIDYSK